MNRIKFFTVFLAIIFLLASLFVLPHYILVDEIVCKNQDEPCSQFLEEKLKILRGKSLSKARSEIVRLLKNDTLVKDFSLHFQLPNRLNVNVSERRPKFTLKSRFSNKTYFISNEGFVLMESTQDFPNIVTIVDNVPSYGGKVDEETLFALKITSLLSSQYQVLSSTKEENFLLIELQDGPRVIFPLEGDLDYLLGKFVLIYSQLNKEDFDFKIKDYKDLEIDLRFENPVLRTG